MSKMAWLIALVLASLVAPAGQAHAITIQGTGVVTEVLGTPGYAVEVGSAFTILYTIDADAPALPTGFIDSDLYAPDASSATVASTAFPVTPGVTCTEFNILNHCLQIIDTASFDRWTYKYQSTSEGFDASVTVLLEGPASVFGSTDLVVAPDPSAFTTQNVFQVIRGNGIVSGVMTSFAIVPEPGTTMLLGLAVLGLRRRAR